MPRTKKQPRPTPKPQLGTESRGRCRPCRRLALAHRATLVTRNLKDFRLVPGLRIENWVD